MSKSIQFAFVIHNQQPVGNFPHIFEWAYQNAYKPFLEVLSRHPTIKVTYHFSGLLLEWLEENHPDFIDKIKELIASKQIELLTGGSLQQNGAQKAPFDCMSICRLQKNSSALRVPSW